tara:strand:+ start:23008 stop:23841 length:834 start_codon:yes stop_codon:yes gene_type:complete
MTGNRGLIGSSLKKRLLEEGHEIIGTFDLREGKDIIDMINLEAGRKVDMVIHAAAHCKINQSISDPKKTHTNDSDGTFSVFEFCRKNNIKKVVYFSSSRILGKEKNPYTSAKIYGEELCKAYKECYGINYLIIRPSTVYGPFWDLTERLMHIFIRNALRDKDLEIFGDPETKTLDFTYVEDFVDGVMLAINHPVWNKEYNISGDEEFNVYELARFIIEKTGSKSRILVNGAEIAQPQKVHLNLEEIKNIGYSKKVPLKEGVLRTIEWYKENMPNYSE